MTVCGFGPTDVKQIQHMCTFHEIPTALKCSRAGRTKPSLSLLPLFQLFHSSEVNKLTLDHVSWHTSGAELCRYFFLLVLLEPSLKSRREKEGFPCSKNFFIQFPLRRGREDGHSSHTEARRCGGEGVLPATSHVPLLSSLPTWKKTPGPLTNSFSRWKNKNADVQDGAAAAARFVTSGASVVPRRHDRAAGTEQKDVSLNSRARKVKQVLQVIIYVSVRTLTGCSAYICQTLSVVVILRHTKLHGGEKDFQLVVRNAWIGFGLSHVCFELTSIISANSLTAWRVGGCSLYCILALSVGLQLALYENVTVGSLEWVQSEVDDTTVVLHSQRFTVNDHRRTLICDVCTQRE